MNTSDLLEQLLRAGQSGGTSSGGLGGLLGGLLKGNNTGNAPASGGLGACSAGLAVCWAVPPPAARRKRVAAG